MVKLDYRYGFPFCQVTLNYKGNSMSLDNVLLDTGSGGTVFKMDKVDVLGVTIEGDDTIETISEVVESSLYMRKILMEYILEIYK